MVNINLFKFSFAKALEMRLLSTVIFYEFFNLLQIDIISLITHIYKDFITK